MFHLLFYTNISSSSILQSFPDEQVDVYLPELMYVQTKHYFNFLLQQLYVIFLVDLILNEALKCSK